MSVRRARTLLALILAIYLALAIGYNIATPIFETPDEHLHYFTAEFIARAGRLPATSDPGLMAQEAAQPPLFYVLAAPVVRAFDPGDAAGQLWVNPRVDVSAVAGQLWTSPLAPPTTRGESVARPPINVNMFVHGPAEAWPWQGYALAARLIRLLATAFGLGTLLCIYAAGRVVWPAAPERALLATALVAFLPQFVFIHAAVSNDAVITFFATATLYQLLRLTEAWRRDGATPAARALLLLGVTIGLAMLSKAAGLLLLAFVGGVVGLLALVAGGERRWARTLARAAGTVALVAGPALLVAGWWLWRNWTLYGDVTAASQFVELTGGYRPYTLYQVWLDMDRVWLSFFAIFGWMNVQPPGWVHIVWNVIVLAALIGALVGLWQQRRSPAAPLNPTPSRAAPTRLTYSLTHPAWLLTGWFLLVAAGWLQFMLRTSADQGRLFFPAILSLALGAAYGLSRWPRPWIQIGAATMALITSVYCVIAVIPPAYEQPPLVERLPAEVMPQMIAFPGTLQLLGARVETPIVEPGEWVWLTMYWQTHEPPASSPFAHLELFDPDYSRIGELVAYHGRGNYPAGLWSPGGIVADRMAVRAAAESSAPMEARLAVKLDEEGDGVTFATVKIVPSRWPAREQALAQLGQAIELAAADLSTTAAPGDSVDVRLRWQVAAPPGPANLHRFVHLGDPAAPPLVQSDGPVMGGRYPARLWAAGEVFEETVTLALPADLPPGNYPIQVGLYDTDTSLRLPVTIDGLREPSDTIHVGMLTVE